MTTADAAEQSERQSLEMDFDLQHPPEKVWRALTEPALLEEWLLPVVGRELRLEPGAEFTYKTQPYPGWDGTVSCKFIEIEPNRKIAYCWTVPFLDTVVTFSLTPTASGTRLSIVQSGFAPAQKRELGGARYGWTMMGQKLTDLLARMP